MKINLSILCCYFTVVNAIDIFRYQSVEDVTEHAKIDLDVKDINDLAKAGDFDGALDVFLNGKHSSKSETVKRTLQGFSTGLVSKANTLKAFSPDLMSEYFLFADYYNDPTYADTFVRNALNNTGPFMGMSSDARAQYGIKGTQYQAIWMYILRELYESVKTCREGGIKEKAWDEGVAFYTGSLIESSGAGSGTLLFTFAQKRCANFETCTGPNGLAVTNDEVFKSFEGGLKAVQDKNCAGISAAIYQIRKQMQIPLIQGVLRYSVKSDIALDPEDGSDKSKAEAWAFALGVLPFIAEKDAAVAQLIHENLEFVNTTNPANYLKDGALKIHTEMYKVLPKLCITCEEIGINNLENRPVCTTNAAWIAANPECSVYSQTLPTAEEDPSNIALIAGLSAGGFVLIIAILAGMWYLSKQNDDVPVRVVAKDDV